MDKRDEVIKAQLEAIRTMTERNIRNLADDLWQSPLFKEEASTADPKSGANLKNGSVDEKSASVKTVSENSAEKSEPAEEEKVETIEELKSELNSYVGLENIKKEVSNLINMAIVRKMRKENGLPSAKMSLHMVFSGNPGTGKTMIARLMARIYKCLDTLSKGQLVEVDRSGLVAGYIGQTAIKTAEVIEKAKGGVLFIDEAYTLSAKKGESDFGQEAIDTILKAMEDSREDLIVIVAGYDGLMDEFIHSNPGLESRFNRFLHFNDYNDDEMLEIFKMQCDKNGYTVSDDACAAVRDYIVFMDTNSISFGNARGVRNIFEKILVCQANRLASAEGVLSREQLMEITADDIACARKEDENADI